MSRIKFMNRANKKEERGKETTISWEGSLVGRKHVQHKLKDEWLYKKTILGLTFASLSIHLGCSL